MLFSTLFKPFLTLSVKNNLENIPYSFCSSFYHWQLDNRNVLGQSWCFQRWCMRKRGNSSIPSRSLFCRTKWQKQNAWWRVQARMAVWKYLQRSSKHISQKYLLSIQSERGRTTAQHYLSCGFRFVSVQAQSDTSTNPARFIFMS